MARTRPAAGRVGAACGRAEPAFVVILLRLLRRFAPRNDGVMDSRFRGNDKRRFEHSDTHTAILLRHRRRAIEGFVGIYEEETTAHYSDAARR